MNIIYQEREHIINNNNTAQHNIESFVETLDKSIKELHIHIELFGNVDCSFLNDYKSLQTIVFQEGSLTGISNLPQSLLHLEIRKNLLVELENLPQHLRTLKIEHNYLTFLDLANTKHLEEVHATFNKLTDIKLPFSIVTCVLNNNNLKHLDMKDYIKLETLNVSENPVLLLENITHIKNLIKDENQMVPISAHQDESSDFVEEAMQAMTYKEALNKYFVLKSKYENKCKKEKYSLLPNKKALKQYIPKCVICGKPGGSTFKRENGNFIGHCNARSPCNFSIIIKRKNDFHIYDMMKDSNAIVDSMKQNFIVQKLDTIMGFITEAESTKLFKEHLEEYNDYSQTHNIFKKAYDEIFDNSIRQESIKNKTQKVYNIIENMKLLYNKYNETTDKNIMTSIMNTYVKDLIPEMRTLQSLKYEISEMEIIEKNKFVTENILHQYEHGAGQFYKDFGEEGVVETFVIDK